MYKPPENSNRVKAIKSKFENNASENKLQAKPPLRKSKTLQDFKVTKTDTPQEKVKINKTHKTAESRNSHQTLSRQLSDPTKRNIKRTPAFRLDKTSDVNNTRFIQNKTRYLEKIAKVNTQDDVTEASEINSKEITFSELRNKFNGNNTPAVNQSSDNSDKPLNTLKFLYSEPVPKSQRNKITNLDNFSQHLHNASTIKISDHDSKTVTSHDNSANETYGNLNIKKNLENLTDTLKNALKKPLPPGPAPKKPPRTFVHTPNKHIDDHQFLPLNLNSDFTKKLNSELQKNITDTKKSSKSDPKYMLDKLETALKKGVLMRKSIKSGNTSEDDSDNEKQKQLNLRELPTIPITQTNTYTSSETSPKFNFNCLPSLSCGSSSYATVKESNSSFFVTCKKEEPVYAEPFEYQLDLEDKYSDDNNSAIESPTGEPGRRAIRRSVHYASSPVPDVKIDEGNNHVSEVKVQDQV